MLSDVEIAQQAKPKHIRDVAAELGLNEDDLIFYGKDKAKVSLDVLEKRASKPDGKLILVTAITPTPAGEGKTTTAIGLADAIRKTRQVGEHRPQRAFARTLLRDQGRGRGRRLRAGPPDGRH
jgi:formyltetrahydrofolate synthetase